MVEVFPEPGDALILIIVGIKPLPLLKIECALGNLLERILLFWLCWYIIFRSRSFFLLFWLLFLFLLLGSWLLFVLTREFSKLLCIKFCHFAAQGNLSQNSLC